jgi:hypothetical protein
MYETIGVTLLAIKSEKSELTRRGRLASLCVACVGYHEKTACFYFRHVIRSFVLAWSPPVFAVHTAKVIVVVVVVVEKIEHLGLRKARLNR